MICFSVFNICVGGEGKEGEGWAGERGRGKEVEEVPLKMLVLGGFRQMSVPGFALMLHEFIFACSSLFCSSSKVSLSFLAGEKELGS